jgi:hypothetical protein
MISTTPHGALQIHLSADVSDQLISLRHTGTPDTIFEHPKERAAHLELIQQEGCAREQGR